MLIKNGSSIGYCFITKDGARVQSPIGSTVKLASELACSSETIKALESIGFEFSTKAAEQPKRKRRDEADQAQEQPEGLGE